MPCCSDVLSFDNSSCWKMSSECQSLQRPCLPFACCTPAGLLGCALLLFFCGGGEGKVLHFADVEFSLRAIREGFCESSCSYQYQCHLQISAYEESGEIEVKMKTFLVPKGLGPTREYKYMHHHTKSLRSPST